MLVHTVQRLSRAVRPPVFHRIMFRTLGKASIQKNGARKCPGSAKSADNSHKNNRSTIALSCGRCSQATSRALLAQRTIVTAPSTMKRLGDSQGCGPIHQPQAIGKK